MRYTHPNKFLIYLWLGILLSAPLSSNATNYRMSCDKISTIIDSIFTNELEETNWAAEITPVLYQRAIELSCSGNEKIFTLAGIIYYNSDKLIDAKDVLTRADSIYHEKRQFDKYFVSTQIYLGLANLRDANQKKAALHYARALEVSEDIDYYRGQLEALLNQTLLFEIKKDPNKLKDLLFQARSLIDKSESQILPGYVFLSLGSAYSNEKDYETANANFEKAKAIWEPINFTKGLYYVAANQAIMARTRGITVSYEDHLKSAIKLMETDATIMRSITYIELGKHYLEQNNEEEALFYLQKGIENTQAHNEEEFLGLVSNLLRIYAKRNDQNKIRSVIEKLFSTYERKLAIVTDEANKWNKKDFILESKIIENNRLKEAQDEANRKIRNRNILLSLLAGIFILLGFLVQGRLNAQKLKEQLRLEQFRTKIAKDLHDDVGTTLASILLLSEAMQLQADEDQKSMLQKMGGKLREAIGSMRDMVWAIDFRKNSPVDLELRIRDYLAAMFASSNIEVHFENAIPKNVTVLPTEIRHAVYLICKESIYNIIKHSDASELVISLSHAQNSIHLDIKDNGTEKEINRSGHGLMNMKDRAEKLMGTFQFNYQNGYRTQVSLPI